MSARDRKGLVHYWTIRYFIVLIVSMVLVGVLLIWFVQWDLQRSQRQGMQKLSGVIADAWVKGTLPQGPPLGHWLDTQAGELGLNGRSVMMVLDDQGEPVMRFPPTMPQEADQIAALREQITTGVPHILTLEPHLNNAPYLVAVHPLPDRQAYILLLLPKEVSYGSFLQFRLPRLLLTCLVLLAGWGIVNALTRSLVKPIREVAGAAQQVVAGNYDVKLSKNYREKEIYELVSAFKEMADRLKRLEALRTQLLAGVTHELKTPVTSISGLVQAVKDGVVTGPEAEIFLEMCLKESYRLQNMVEDLLDFNSFAAGTMSVTMEPCDLNKAVREIAMRWQYGQEGHKVRLNVETAGDGPDWMTPTDPIRLEQILVNLFNNARDAMDPNGVIHVRLERGAGMPGLLIRVADTGRGIPPAEQVDVFEPFYRGNGKKQRVRGLGLGLPFSRLIARNLGGDLVLTSSSPNGTTFTVILPETMERPD